MWTSLIGFMASGKSAVGRHLHGATGRSVVHLDALVEEREGRTIADIFAREGEAAFRQAEMAALESLAGQRGLILDAGGGLVQIPAAVSLLQRRGVVIWLDPPWEVLRRRLQAGPEGQRPLVESLGWDGLEQLFHRRRRLYARAADFRLPVADGGIQELARLAMLRSLMWQRREEPRRARAAAGQDTGPEAEGRP